MAPRVELLGLRLNVVHPDVNPWPNIVYYWNVVRIFVQRIRAKAIYNPAWPGRGRSCLQAALISVAGPSLPFGERTGRGHSEKRRQGSGKPACFCDRIQNAPNVPLGERVSPRRECSRGVEVSDHLSRRTNRGLAENSRGGYPTQNTVRPVVSPVSLR